LSVLETILFDLDDTLISWGDFAMEWETHEMPHIQHIFAYLQSHVTIKGGFGAFKEAYFQRSRKAWFDARHTLVAPHLGKVLVDTAKHFSIPDDKADMDVLLDIYQWGRVEGTHPFPEVIHILTRLKKAGLKLGIVTNAYQPMRLRDVELEQHGLLEFFPDCRLSAADAGYLKPHASIFEQALQRAGTTPERTIFIGDNPTADIAGGQAAGMRTIMRIIGRSRPLISGVIVPDAAINSLEELPAILDEWFPDWESA
jgi:HAD superfamily hydrolase (TIGR01662 family)